MNLSPLGPSKRTYLGLTALCVLAAGLVQWQLVERGRRAALGPPKKSIASMVELWPVLMGGFRGPIVASLAYFASEREIEADVRTTLSTIRTLSKVQPEFEHLWIYYAWVISYNIPAVVNSPEERYAFILDGCAHLEEGAATIAKLYEVNRPCANDRDPMKREPLDLERLAPDTTRTLQDETVGFSDVSNALAWDSLTDDQKAIHLEAVRAGSVEYKRKRTTLLYMIGWTYYQKLALSEDARKWYRPWFIRDRRQDPYQVAYTFLARASAIDVPPYQVSYEVIKTSPGNCLADRARALAADPKVPTKIVAEAFGLANDEWAKALPYVKERKTVAGAVRELELVAQAMTSMAHAEERAAVANEAEAKAGLTAAQQTLYTLFEEQPQASYREIYVTRLNLARERVRKALAGERM